MESDSIEKPDPVAEYKILLKGYLERRPSGTRQKLAEAIGTNKSFISQVTNPTYKVPLPAQHIPALFRICHLSPEEQQVFLEIYRRAHPAQSVALAELAMIEEGTLKVAIPTDLDPDTRQQVEQIILEFADRVITLARGNTHKK